MRYGFNARITLRYRLMQAQEEDFMAAGYLSRFYDAQLLNAILQANRSKRVMDVNEPIA